MKENWERKSHDFLWAEIERVSSHSVVIKGEFAAQVEDRSASWLGIPEHRLT
jgi:hypothetical protein